ncbi:ATP-binding mismatch repair protein [Collariella sp. IMI 366227]|nr:ATP-binding mismatch repair protein [Collariella sp. IMI 366227]
MTSIATIKAIESSTVHQIQSGQVIVDLCSVAKELVENSVDAGATSVGLDSIEVQDNGSGIAPHNHESVALKHYTSKLVSYEDLSELQTFGFRGEALSSLCALSCFSIVTCTKDEAPRASRLEFERSGKLKGTSVVSGQKGTTVIVEDLFHNLPVRRRELERNIKREWGKVINLLNQYACVQTGVKFTVSQQPTKGKRMVLFSTKGNPTTRENIINVFGVKTMNALIAMDLRLKLTPTTGPLNKGKARVDGNATEVRILGHVSRPTHGEGRQTPDRQMFYVNGRPCGLPQFAKVFNEVYRSYNASQSPFIFADIQLDTHLYDVNVSPDKRTILLHDQGQMLDNLRESLIELFETQDVTIPVSQAAALKQTPFKTPVPRRSGTPTSAQLSTRAGTVESQRQSEKRPPVRRRRPVENEEDEESGGQTEDEEDGELEEEGKSRTGARGPKKPPSSFQNVTVLSRWLAKTSGSQDQVEKTTLSTEPQTEAGPSAKLRSRPAQTDISSPSADGEEQILSDKGVAVEDEDGHDQARTSPTTNKPEAPILAILPPSQPPASRLGPTSTTRAFKRSTQEVATITIGDHTVTSLIGNTAKRPRMEEPLRGAKPTGSGKVGQRNVPLPSFGGRLSQLFSASARPGEVAALEIGAVAEENGEDVEVDDEEGDAEKAEGGEKMGRRDTPMESVEDSPSYHGDHAEEDDEYIDDTEKKAREDKKVQEMIDAAEAAGEPTEEGEKRSNVFVKGRPKRKDMTLNLAQNIKTSSDEIKQRLASLTNHLPPPRPQTSTTKASDGLEAADAEEKLSLKISKSDFAKMRIVGQFNLGFILAVREASNPSPSSLPADDELFIIDQHASDEKYNFERLQSTTTVQSQRLVRPKTLSLTALEEEIILEHLPSLERNGFLVRETTFGLADLEELLFLLADNPTSNATTVPRPSKVRKMFAMRACRSSIMIGSALSQRQMERVVKHMGEMEKPWNLDA